MPRVLVIDDYPQVRTMISIALKAKGFEVVTAESGAAGTREFNKSRFDLAIIDIYMPEMDGAKIIKVLRERIPDFPIIAISGVMLRNFDHTALDFLSMAPGFANVVCLQKPFRPPELFQAIKKAIGVAA